MKAKNSMKLCICMFMILGLFLLIPITTAHAVEKLETPTNLRWDGTKATWDEVPNATSYSFSFKMSYGDNKSSNFNTSTNAEYYECNNAIKSMINTAGLTGGTVSVVFKVRARTTDYDNFMSGDESEYSEPISYEVPAREKLPTPSNLHWDGTTAMWDEVPNANGYSFTLKFCYGENRQSTSNTTVYDTSRECQNTIKSLINSAKLTEGNVTVSFKVRAQTNDYDNFIRSDESDYSEEIIYEVSERQKLETPSNLYWDATTAKWGSVENASTYSFTFELLYDDKRSTFNTSVKEEHYDCNNAVKSMLNNAGVMSGTATVRFKVRANTRDLDHYMQSDESEYSVANTWTIIDGVAFNSSDKIVYLPADTKVIEKEAFAETAVEKIIIPEGCEIIEEYAFRNCVSLKYISIPSSIKSIAENAFEGCGDVEIERK